jgi:hypothetical protein
MDYINELVVKLPYDVALNYSNHKRHAWCSQGIEQRLKYINQINVETKRNHKFGMHQ